MQQEKKVHSKNQNEKYTPRVVDDREVHRQTTNENEENPAHQHTQQHALSIKVDPIHNTSIRMNTTTNLCMYPGVGPFYTYMYVFRNNRVHVDGYRVLIRL